MVHRYIDRLVHRYPISSKRTISFLIKQWSNRGQTLQTLFTPYLKIGVTKTFGHFITTGNEYSSNLGLLMMWRVINTNPLIVGYHYGRV